MATKKKRGAASDGPATDPAMDPAAETPAIEPATETAGATSDDEATEPSNDDETTPAGDKTPRVPAKVCGVCLRAQPAHAATCEHCGEASWTELEAIAPEPEG